MCRAKLGGNNSALDPRSLCWSLQHVTLRRRCSQRSILFALAPTFTTPAQGEHLALRYAPQ